MNNKECIVRRKLKAYYLMKNKIKYLGLDDKDILKKVNFVDECLNMFNTNDKKFIIDVYILDKNYSDINCSKSNFYYKKYKSYDTLINMLSDIKW